MGSTKRATRSVLTQKLIERPRSHSFLKAVELVQQACNKGRFELASLSEEAFLFRANPSFGFPASDIQDVVELKNNKYEFVVNFMGLYGPSSPLPDFFTQAVIDEQVEVEANELTTFYLHSLNELLAYQENRLDMVAIRKRMASDIVQIRQKRVSKVVLTQAQVTELKNDEPIENVLSEQQYDDLLDKRIFIEIHHAQCANQRDFLDVFNHRLITLYLGALRKYHPYQAVDFSQDYYCDVLLAFIGAPPKEKRESSPIQWRKLLQFAGLLSMKQGSSESICKVIAGYFELPLNTVFIEEHVLRVVKISDDQRSQLGAMNMCLGDTFICGKTVNDRNSKFRLHLSELAESTFKHFLPIQPSSTRVSGYKELIELLDFLKSPEQLADVCLHLKQEQKLPMKLTQGSPIMLGYTSWLEPTQTQSCQVVI
jgi:type VI secretion system ImpH/TssG family protein